MQGSAAVSGSWPWNASVATSRAPRAPLEVPSSSVGVPFSPGPRCGEFIVSSSQALTVAAGRNHGGRRNGTVPSVTDMTWLDASAQADLVRRGDASPAELVD